MHFRFPSFAALCILSAAIGLHSGRLDAAEIYVSPAGNDSNPGTLDQPIATVAHAQELARSGKASGPVTVYLRGGVYYLASPLIFTAADSGAAGAPVTYQAYQNEQPVISGGMKLQNLDWKPFRNGIMQTPGPRRFANRPIICEWRETDSGALSKLRSQ